VTRLELEQNTVMSYLHHNRHFYFIANDPSIRVPVPFTGPVPFPIPLFVLCGYFFSVPDIVGIVSEIATL
jgi:hypothetical protein